VNIGQFREVLNDCTAGCEVAGDSFFLSKGDFVVGAVRVRDKYSNAFQEVSYWLCAGHDFITLSGKRDARLSDNHDVYPFRIPWDTVASLSRASLEYDPDNFDDRHYQPAVIRYGELGEGEVRPAIQEVRTLLTRAFMQIQDLSKKEAAEKIALAAANYWLCQEYLHSYARHGGIARDGLTRR
jgi:hypothetical protein